jgi:hypothetical protein
MCLHGKKGAVWRRLRMVRNVDAAEVTSAIVVSIDHGTVGKNMGEGALGAELAVPLVLRSDSSPEKTRYRSPTLVKYLHGARSVMGSSECKNGHAFPA